MSKHTPGPWMQDEDRPFDILFDDRAGENVTPIIASVHTDNTDDEQWQADARLIAAAPDLCHAAKAALFVLRLVYQREFGTNESGAIAALEEAIAKAEGRANG